MILSLDEPRPIDSRGRASPPEEASSGELSGELFPNVARLLTLECSIVPKVYFVECSS